MDGLTASLEKMRREGLPDAAIDTFRFYYEQLVAGVTGMVAEDEIEPLSDVADADALPDSDAAEYLENYHELVFADPDAAYQQAGPTLQGAISQEGFRGFWGDFADANISDVQVAEDGRSATAQLEFVYADGTSQLELHSFVFTERDGRLVLDSDTPEQVLRERS